MAKIPSQPGSEFPPEPPAFDEADRRVGARWVFGIAGTWLILSLLSDVPATRELASAFAITIAVSATFVLWEPATTELRKLG